jgi:pimeloyl-ACP methyl ester carboxylesterase
LSERVIPEAGHMLHHDQPERLAAVIEEFLG